MARQEIDWEGGELKSTQVQFVVLCDQGKH